MIDVRNAHDLCYRTRVINGDRQEKCSIKRISQSIDESSYYLNVMWFELHAMRRNSYVCMHDAAYRMGILE